MSSSAHATADKTTAHHELRLFGRHENENLITAVLHLSESVLVWRS